MVEKTHFPSPSLLVYHIEVLLHAEEDVQEVSGLIGSLVAL